jgi:hypothetical protein
VILNLSRLIVVLSSVNDLFLLNQKGLMALLYALNFIFLFSSILCFFSRSSVPFLNVIKAKGHYKIL